MHSFYDFTFQQRHLHKIMEKNYISRLVGRVHYMYFFLSIVKLKLYEVTFLWRHPFGHIEPLNTPPLPLTDPRPPVRAGLAWAVG